MPASTTKTYARTTIEKACEKAKARVLEDLGNSVFKDAADLTCKLLTKYIKEELFK